MEEGSVPEYVRNFVVGFHLSVKRNNLADVKKNYEGNWKQLTDKFYKQSAWPQPELIAPLVENDPLFICLYSDLYFRHLFTRLHEDITLVQRVKSWENYLKFFNLLIDAEKPLNVALPLRWIWEFVDEFVYQYQDFSQYRTKAQTLSQDDINYLTDNPGVWNSIQVLVTLEKLIAKSDIKNTLISEKRRISVNPRTFAGSKLYSYIGYFSIINLARVHVISGDYYHALQTLSVIDINRKGRYTEVSASHVAVFYYLGWCYVVMRRYRDAIKVFSDILLHDKRQAPGHHHGGYDQKTCEKMYALLALLLTFSHSRLDEQLLTTLNSEHADKVHAMKNLEIEPLFSYTCPKFIDPAPFNYSGGGHISSPLAQQRGQFMLELNQQKSVPIIQSYLSLYSSIDVEKLYALLEKKVEKDALRNQLVSFVHKTRQRQRPSGGSVVEGSFKTSKALQFTLSGDNLITITHHQEGKASDQLLLKRVDKCADLIQELRH